MTICTKPWDDHQTRLCYHMQRDRRRLECGIYLLLRIEQTGSCGGRVVQKFAVPSGMERFIASGSRILLRTWI